MKLPVLISTLTFKLENSSLFYPSDFVAICTFINFSQVQKRNYKLNGIVCHTLPLCRCPWPCHVIAVSQVRLRDHGAWPGISQYFISHLALFISHLAFFTLHVAFFNLASCISLSHISHFYLASCINFTSRICFSSVIKSHLECPLQTSVIPLTMLNMKKQVAWFSVSVLACGSVPIVMGLCYMRVSL